MTKKKRRTAFVAATAGSFDGSTGNSSLQIEEIVMPADLQEEVFNKGKEIADQIYNILNKEAKTLEGCLAVTHALGMTWGSFRANLQFNGFLMDKLFSRYVERYSKMTLDAFNEEKKKKEEEKQKASDN